MTLADLTFGPVCGDLSIEDHALQINEAIAGVVDLEAECEDLRARVAELDDIEEAHEKLGREHDELETERDKLEDQLADAKKQLAEREAELVALEGHGAGLDHAARAEAAIEALRDLVGAIRDAKIGKTARVGSLIVVGADRDFASELGDALEKAEAIL